MAEALDRHLVKAIADVVIFLEFSDDATVDPDAAVQAMEQMGSELGAMEPRARAQLCAQMVAVAVDYTDPEHRAFVAGLPESFGLLGG